MEFSIIELNKVKRMYELNKENKKAQWMLFLDDPNTREVKDIMEKNEDIKEAVVEVRKMTEDEKMERLAFLRQKAIMDEKSIYAAGIDKGIKQGIEQGIEIKQKEIAKKLEKEGMAREKILEITGIDLDKE
jgi:predicted transposase/invertase (TIGR01784 family)